MFEVKSYTEISQAVKDLAMAGSVFKGQVFRANLKNKMVSIFDKNKYLTTAQAMINTWSDYADKIVEAVDHADKDVKPKYIYCSYDDAEDILYGRYDYASVLPFADGCVRGVQDGGKFDDPDDIEDFFEHTVDKAFKNRASSTAGLLEEVDFGPTNSDPDTDDYAHFRAVKGQKLFKYNDARELNKAIEKVCDFITDPIDCDAPQMMISVVNNIIEYMTYSVVAYATRVYTIGRYFGPFIEDKGAVEAHTESVEQADSLNSGVMSTFDNPIFRDIHKTREIQKFMNEWLQRISGQEAKDIYDKPGLSVPEYNFPREGDLKQNPFYDKLLGNQLAELLRRASVYYRASDKWSTIGEFHDSLKEFTHNSLQAIGGTTTPKQEMMAVIKSTEPESKTEEKYKELAKDLVNYCMYLLSLVLACYDMTTYDSKDVHRHVSINGTERTKTMTETMDMLKELFTDISTAMLTKAQDIEMHIADIKNESLKKKMGELTIEVPGKKESDISSNDNTMMGVPDTTRSSTVDIAALYALPKMESLEMYDEYVQTILDGDPYYEAGAISSVINAIMAFIDGCFKRVRQFFTNAQFSAAVTWCSKHQQELKVSNYTGEMSVKPYVVPMKIDMVDKMTDAIKAINLENIKDDNDIGKIVQSMYAGNTALYNATRSSDTNVSQNMLLEYILFNRTPAATANTFKATEAITIRDNDIKDRLVSTWLPTVLGSQETYNGLNTTLDNLKNAVKAFQQNVVKATENTQGNQAMPAAPAAPAANNAGTNNTTANNTSANTNNNANGNQQNNVNTNNNSLMNSTSTAVQKEVTLIMNGTYTAVTSSIREMYSYIQQAYNLRAK